MPNCLFLLWLKQVRFLVQKSTVQCLQCTKMANVCLQYFTAIFPRPLQYPEPSAFAYNAYAIIRQWIVGTSPIYYRSISRRKYQILILTFHVLELRAIGITVFKSYHALKRLMAWLWGGEGYSATLHVDPLVGSKGRGRKGEKCYPMSLTQIHATG